MDLSFSQQLQQRQMLSANQIQSLRILAMNSTELSDYLQNEYLENPLLECDESRGSVGADISRYYEQNLTYNRSFDELVEEEDRRRQDIPDRDVHYVRNYILEQLDPADYSAQEWQLIGFFIDMLDDNGFLNISPQEIAARTDIDISVVMKILSGLRGLEPVGIFAEDLRECLLLQLAKGGQQDSIAWQIVSDHMEDLRTGKISAISRSLHVSTAQARKAIEQIARLNPHPLNGIGEPDNAYIRPDIVITRNSDGFEASLNDKWVEDYHLSDYYMHMMQEAADESLREYFGRKLERARFVMNSILQRRKTLLAISNAIIVHQPEYLARGGFPAPMTMCEIAGELGINTSTVSRAIHGKYIQTPQGTMAVREMFRTPAVKNGEGECPTVGAEEIKEIIRELISGEDPHHPLSDQAITNLLSMRDIHVSRRAVAKYRDAMGIWSSAQRKR